MAQVIASPGTQEQPTTRVTPLKDARPSLPTSDTSLWDFAIKDRDRIADLLTDAFKARNILAFVRKSKPGEYPPFVFVDQWIPTSETADRTTTDRSSLRLEIKVMPYLENPFSYNVTLERHGKTFTHEHWEISNEEIEGMASYLIDGGDKPKFFKSKVSRGLLIAGMFFPPLLWGAFPKNKTIPEARANWFTLATLLAVLGAGIFLWGVIGWIDTAQYYYQDPSGFIGLTALGAVALGTAFYVRSRRPKLHSVPSQSRRTPRHEFLVDSWHVSVPNGAVEFAGFRDRLIQAVSHMSPDIETELEVHQRLSPRGFEERERLVLTKGQANVHVHVYPFGKDAFVGWDGYMNWAKWQETNTEHARVTDGVEVMFKSLEAGVHIPSEFDLMELNALSEMVHRKLVSEIKVFLKEQEIEAELDFKIIRGDRDKALTAGNDKKTRRGSSFLDAARGRS